MDNSLKTYDYQYDALNRIIQGSDNTGYFDLGSDAKPITYDKNGNIQKLLRLGHVINTSNLADNATDDDDYGVMDDLTYAYSGNRLQSVSDLGAGTGFVDGNPSGIDYGYDDNGNMTSDANKGIPTDGVEYNHLNLPTKVTINGGTIQYVYDATGVKLKKTLSTGTETDYCGNYIYEGPNGGNATLQFFGTPEGYVEPNTTGGYEYIYQYTDHLGNVRLSYKNAGTASNPDLEIQEENNYYPFGLKHKGYNSVINSSNVAQDFKYNGVEHEDALGLNLYEMDWRGYDASLGRFRQIDPQAMTYYEWSPYHFAANNPNFISDPDGQDWIITRSYDKNGNVTYNITINAAVLNSSKDDFDKNDVVNTTKNQLETAFSTFLRSDDGRTTTVNVTANVRSIDGIDELGENEHLIDIVDDWKLKDKRVKGKVLGKAPLYGLRASISSSVLAKALDGTNKRTIAHEIGHTGGLMHPEDHERTDKNQHLSPGDNDDNIMYQGSYALTILGRGASRDAEINVNQALILHRNFKKKKLNQKNNGYHINFFGKRLFSIKRNP